MSITIDLQIASTCTAIPTIDALNGWIEHVLQHQQRDTAEVSIKVVDMAESQTLNDQYRGKNKPTNVLSFPADFPEGISINFLGDLVICARVLQQEAEAQHKTIEAHWAHIVTHGTLHLLGYDHIEDDEANIMETLESQLLQALGYQCPYQSS